MLEVNRVYFGDGLGVCREISDNSVDLIVIDPPYGGLIDQEWDSNNGLTGELLDEYWRILKETGSLYIFCGIGEKSNSLFENLKLIQETPFIFKDLITWKKQRGWGSRRGWLYTREEIIWLVKDSKKFFWNSDNQYNPLQRRNYKRKVGKSWYKRYTNVWDDIMENVYEDIKNDRTGGNWLKNFTKKYPTLHKTIKPIGLIDRIVNAHTKPNSGYLVLDTFAGTSTTAISSIRGGCNWIMVEKEPEFWEVSNQRVWDYITNGESESSTTSDPFTQNRLTE
jgi:site-specific DNA-methyltransferase (adenine-specific)